MLVIDIGKPKDCAGKIVVWIIIFFTGVGFLFGVVPSNGWLRIFGLFGVASRQAINGFGGEVKPELEKGLGLQPIQREFNLTNKDDKR